jgi:hypothetical protein
MYLIERLNSQEDSTQIIQKCESFERLISLPENDTFSQSHCPQEKVGLAHESTNALDLHTCQQEGISMSSKSDMNLQMHWTCVDCSFFIIRKHLAYMLPAYLLVY